MLRVAGLREMGWDLCIKRIHRRGGCLPRIISRSPAKPTAPTITATLNGPASRIPGLQVVIIVINTRRAAITTGTTFRTATMSTPRGTSMVGPVIHWL